MAALLENAAFRPALKDDPGRRISGWRRSLSLLLCSVVTAPLLGTAAHAQETSSPDTIVVEGERSKQDQKICKKTEPPTGSRLGSRRVCRTALEWKMAEEQSQRVIENHQEHQRAEDAYYQNLKNGLAQPGPK